MDKIDKDLQKLKDIYLTGVDEEDYADNLEKINEWEQGIRESEDFGSWQESDVTKSILQKAKETYKTLCLELITRRDLTDVQRNTIFAKRDATAWIVSMIEKDTKAVLETIHSEIMKALKVE